MIVYLKNKTAAEGELIVVVSCRGLTKKVLSLPPPHPSPQYLFQINEHRIQQKDNLPKASCLQEKETFLNVHVYLHIRLLILTVNRDNQTGKGCPTFQDHS